MDPSQFSGKLPIGFTPIPDGRLLVLTADASTFSIDLRTGRCTADGRFRRSHRVGRAITFHPPSHTLLIVADGRAAAPAAPGGHSIVARTPSVAAWSLAPRASPRLLASVKGARADPAERREFWRVQLSPDGRLVAVGVNGNWSITAGPDAKFQALQVQREDAEAAVRVVSVAWEDETNALVAWGDGAVHRLEFEAMKSLYVPMRSVGVNVEEGVCVSRGYAAAEGGGDGAAMLKTVVLEPVWEDGAGLEQVREAVDDGGGLRVGAWFVCGGLWALTEDAPAHAAWLALARGYVWRAAVHCAFNARGCYVVWAAVAWTGNGR